MHENLAMLYNRMGKNDKAESLLTHMTEEFPDQVEAFYSLALLLSEMGKFDASMEYLILAAKK